MLVAQQEIDTCREVQEEGLVSGARPAEQGKWPITTAGLEEIPRSSQGWHGADGVLAVSP